MYALTHVGVLVGLTFVGTLQPGPVEQYADPMKVMEHARELADDGRHEEALAELLWCFDNGAKENPSFSGVRVSFLLRRITELGQKYAPALDALRERRDAAEQRAGKTKGTPRYMFYLMDVAALNHSLGEDAANLALYDELRSEVPDSPLLGFLRHFVADELVKTGRVDEARADSAPAGERPRATRMPAVIERAWPRDVVERQESSSSVRSTTAYSLDAVGFEQELAAAVDEAARLNVLNQRWNDVVLAVSYCDVVTDKTFHRSVRHWQSGSLVTGTWTVQAGGDLRTAHDSLSKATVLVKGDCRADITVSDGGMLHIYGDLGSNLTLSGHIEVVIGGDITQDGAIDGDGIIRVFVGGHLEGQISNKGSSMLWINGDVTGSIHAGRPVARIHVIGDFLGHLLPVDVAYLGSLDVRGYMPSGLIEEVARYGWTEFSASVGSSDMPPGIYPKSQTSPSRWVVHSQHP